MKPVRYAVVGSGAIAATHARAIAEAERSELAAIWGRDAGRSQALADEHGVDFSTDIERLASRDDIHAATIATPSGAHEVFAIPFLKRGKAVLCEKPMEIRLDRIDRMVAAADEHGAILAGVFQMRLGAGAQALKKAVESGRFGRLTLCSGELRWWRDQDYYDSVGWRGTKEFDGGGALMNQGIHLVDLLQWIAGMPCEVSANTALLAHRDIEVEDTVSASLRFPGGALGTIEAATSCRPGSAMRLSISGDRGSAVLENDKIVFWRFDEEGEEDDAIRAQAAGLITGGASSPKVADVTGHRLLVEDLSTSIQEGRLPAIDGKEARRAVELILAIYESARLREFVRSYETR